MTTQLKFLGLFPLVSHEFRTLTLLEAIATTTATKNYPFLHPQTKNHQCRCFHLPPTNHFCGTFSPKKKSTESGPILGLEKPFLPPLAPCERNRPSWNIYSLDVDCWDFFWGGSNFLGSKQLQSQLPTSSRKLTFANSPSLEKNLGLLQT